MATFSGDLLLPRLSLLPRGGRRVLPRGVKRGVFSAWVMSDNEVRPVLKIPPHPLPTLVAIVPQKHIAALERNGKFVKMIGSGKHFLFPFFEKVNGVYRNEYPIPELTGFHVGGTIKLQLINMARHKEQSVDVVMAKARTVLEEMISESYLFEGVVKDKWCNKFAEEKINQKLVEDPTNNYSMVLNMRYVKKLSPTEVAERIKKNMRQKKIMQEKEELKKKTNAKIACHVAVAILAVIAIVIVPKELQVYITGAMQIYIMWSFPR